MTIKDVANDQPSSVGKRQPRKVFVVFRETNTGHSDDSDGYVVGVYSTQEKADRARVDAMRRAIRGGDDVYYDSDNGKEQVHWDCDWRVEEWPVQTKSPRPVKPARYNDSGEILNPLGGGR